MFQVRPAPRCLRHPPCSPRAPFPSLRSACAVIPGVSPRDRERARLAPDRTAARRDSEQVRCALIESREGHPLRACVPLPPSHVPKPPCSSRGCSSSCSAVGGLDRVSDFVRGLRPQQVGGDGLAGHTRSRSRRACAVAQESPLRAARQLGGRRLVSRILLEAAGSRWLRYTSFPRPPSPPSLDLPPSRPRPLALPSSSCIPASSVRACACVRGWVWRGCA